MNEKRLMNDKEIRHFTVAFIVMILLLATVTVIVFTQKGQNTTTTRFERNPKFILSTWSYPDEYGQGIEAFELFENSTGSWVQVNGAYGYDETEPIKWEVGVAIKLRCYTYFNSTLTGAGSTNEGKLYQRHNVTVIKDTVEVFSQQNFTFFYVDVIDPPMWLYGYEVVLDFIPAEFSTYIITVNYEVYFETFGWGESYLHDCSDTSDITYSSNSGLDPEDYGIGSNGSIVEIWIVPDSVSDEYVIYKLDFTNIDNSDGDINLTVRYRVEDGFIGFRLDLYYDDATSDSTGVQVSQTWSNLTIDADSGKVLDYALLRCDDTPNSVTSGNRSVYIDFIEITNPTDTLEYFELRWNTISTPVLYFETPLSPVTQWTFNMIFIFGGLVLMIGSACIVAKKVRDRTINTDNILLFLLLFFVGWCFFAGGGVLG